MLAVLCCVLATACGQGPVEAPRPCGSFLYQPASCLGDVHYLPAEAYVPQPGDIMLRLDPNLFWRVTHYLALAFDPNGSAIVFARPDGTLAILEAGPNDILWCGTRDLVPH